MSADKPWIVYLLHCRPGTLYCGVTVNYASFRLEAHIKTLPRSEKLSVLQSASCVFLS